MTRIELETTLNESRNWLLATFSALSDEQLRTPLTPSEHDPTNLWSALDHFAHLALIERNFEGLVRRSVAGDDHPVDLLRTPSGEARSREDIMATVHKMTDAFQQKHHNDSLDEVITLTGGARAATLQLISELSEAQLLEKVPGAPWGDGTVGGVLGANAGHGKMHWKWLQDAGLTT